MPESSVQELEELPPDAAITADHRNPRRTPPPTTPTPMPADPDLLVSSTSASPMNWKPASPDDLIGQAARVAEAQVTKAQRLAGADPPNGSMKLLLYGPPGVGKTSVVEMVARQLTGSPLAIEDFNGRADDVMVVVPDAGFKKRR